MAWHGSGFHCLACSDAFLCVPGVALAWHYWRCRYRSYNLSSSSCVVLRNKPPRWNQAVGAYCLNFGGRVTQASVKNFQLVSVDNMVGARWASHAVHAVRASWAGLRAPPPLLPMVHAWLQTSAAPVGHPIPFQFHKPPHHVVAALQLGLHYSCSQFEPPIPSPPLATCRSARSCSLARWRAMPSPWTTATP